MAAARSADSGGRTDASRRTRTAWLLGWHGSNLSVFFFANLKTGHRRVIVNGIELCNVKAPERPARWTFESWVADERHPHDQARGLGLRLEQRGRRCELYVDGHAVETLRASSAKLRGSPPPVLVEGAAVLRLDEAVRDSSAAPTPVLPVRAA